MAASKTIPRKFIIPLSVDFQYDKRKDGWELMEGVPMKIGTGETTFELAEFLHKGEERVNGDVMMARAKELGGITDQHYAELLLARQAEIPEEWRNFYLVFPGTVWRDPRGDHDVPCLRWNGDRWYLHWFWLVGGWDSDIRLVRLCT